MSMRQLYPIKVQGETDMGRLFKHLTCEEVLIENEDGSKYPKRVLNGTFTKAALDPSSYKGKNSRQYRYFHNRGKGCKETKSQKDLYL